MNPLTSAHTYPFSSGVLPSVTNGLFSSVSVTSTDKCELLYSKTGKRYFLQLTLTALTALGRHGTDMCA